MKKEEASAVEKLFFNFPQCQGNKVVLIDNQELPIWKMRSSGASGKDMS